MSAIRRRSTVHDLASLRLHPDGSRVQNIASSGVSAEVAVELNTARASANTRTRPVRTTVRDAQGNWIARDAGGRATVKYKRRVRKVGGKGAEGSKTGEELDSEHGTREHSLDLDGETEGEEGSQGVKDPRAKKRMKFLHDYSFLETNSSPQLGMPGPSNLSHSATDTFDLPVPSSDLLKFIHYFASEHYAADGLLFDASREFRKERKVRKMQKLRKRTLKKMRRRDAESEDDNSSGESEEGSDLDNSSSGEEEPSNDQKKLQRGAPRKGKAPSRDMYRAFDGSALMAIGMLLQEHVLQTMSSAPPEGWEEEMLQHEANANVVGKGGRRIHRAKQIQRFDIAGINTRQNSAEEYSQLGQKRSKRDSDDSDEDSSSESEEFSSE